MTKARDSACSCGAPLCSAPKLLPPQLQLSCLGTESTDLNALRGPVRGLPPAPLPNTFDRDSGVARQSLTGVTAQAFLETTGVRVVNTIAECTVPEKILLAAYHLEEQGHSPFSAESLIVAAWQKYPKTFGLRGYTDQYPDSNKVLSSIMGERGLTRRGWLAKMGQKLYALTRDGRHVVQRLLKGEDVETVRQTVKLSRDQEKALLALLASTAVQKMEEGRKDELTFADACRWWGITENLHGEALNARLEKTRASLTELARLIGAGTAELSNGRAVSMDDLALLSQVHEYLEERFSRHLTLLRNRAASRT